MPGAARRRHRRPFRARAALQAETAPAWCGQGGVGGGGGRGAARQRQRLPVTCCVALAAGTAAGAASWRRARAGQSSPQAKTKEAVRSTHSRTATRPGACGRPAAPCPSAAAAPRLPSRTSATWGSRSSDPWHRTGRHRSRWRRRRRSRAAAAAGAVPRGEGAWTPPACCQGPPPAAGSCWGLVGRLVGRRRPPTGRGSCRPTSPSHRPGHPSHRWRQAGAVGAAGAAAAAGPSCPPGCRRVVRAATASWAVRRGTGAGLHVRHRELSGMHPNMPRLCAEAATPALPATHL